VSAGRPRKLAPDDPRLGSGAQPAPVQLSDDAVWTRLSAGADRQVAKTATDVELHESVLTGVDLSGRDLRRLIARDVRFEHCDLSGAVLDSASLQRVEFVDCRMTAAMLTNARLRDVTIRGCRADLTNWRMSSATYLLADSSSLREADFYDMQLTKAALLHCDLREASFRACQLRDVDLHGSQIDDLRDISGLAGVAVGGDQVVPLALALLSTFGISVTDQPRMGGLE
jgi:uncharacterized protein YjbI with pentapeptide repeats